MIQNQMNIFEYLGIEDTFRLVLFKNLKEAVYNLPDTPHKHMKYKHYIDLMYMAVFKKTARKIKNEHGIDKNQSLAEIFSYKQKLILKQVEKDICLQLSEDLDYNEIKRIIMEKYKDVKLELIS